MLLPGGAVEALEQLKERLDEHCDPRQQWLSEMLAQPRGRTGADTSLMALDSKGSPAGSPSLRQARRGLRASLCSQQHNFSRVSTNQTRTGLCTQLWALSG